MSEILQGETGNPARRIRVLTAAIDPDLVAYHELNSQGFTDRVSDSRADALEECSAETLRAEIRRDYGLDEAELVEAEHICLDAINDRTLQDKI